MEIKETKTTTEQKTVTGHAPLTEPADHSAPEEHERKRRYTGGTGILQEIGLGFNQAAVDLTRAVSVAMETYQERADRSSYDKRDGMVKDMLQNVTKAASAGLKEAADAPYDLVKTVTSGKFKSKSKSK